MTTKRSTPDPRAVAFGLAVGAGLGVTIWVVTDLFVFFPVFLAIGLTLGTAWSQSEPTDDADQRDKATSKKG